MFPKYEYRNNAIYVSVRQQLGTFPPRFHKHLEMLMVSGGQARATIDGTEYTLDPGDVYVVFPNIVHSLQAPNAQGVVVIVDFGMYEAYHDILVKHMPDPPILRKGQFSEAAYGVFERMGQLKDTDLAYKQNALAGYANALLGELLSHMNLKDRNVDDGLLQQLILYILENYTREITLEDVAQELSYSKFYISRVVSNTFGCNFRTLINTYRVSMAQNLLVSSAKSISEVAYECGFKNQSSFNRIFLTHSGITPSDYRKKMGPPPEKPILYVRS